MDSLDNDINSILNYYVKRDDVLLAPATNDYDTSATVSKNNSIKDFHQSLKRQFSTSSTSIEERLHQHRASILIANVPISRTDPFEYQAQSHLFEKNIIKSARKQSVQIFGKKIKKYKIKLPTSLLIKKQKHSEHKGEFIGTAVATSGRSMGTNSVVTLNDHEDVVKESNVDNVQPVAKKNVRTRIKKHAQHFFQRLSTKNRLKNWDKNVFNGTEVTSSGRYLKLKGGGLPEKIDSEQSELIVHKNEVTGDGKHIPHFLKSLMTKKLRHDRQVRVVDGTAVDYSYQSSNFRSKIPLDRSDNNQAQSLVEDLESITNIKDSEPVDNTVTGKLKPHFLNSLFISKKQGSKQKDFFSRNSAVKSGYVANLKGGSTLVHNNINEMQVQKSSVQDCNAVDLVDTSDPVRVVAELEIKRFEKVSKCDCEERRLKLIVDSLLLMVSKNKNNDLKNQQIKSLQQINPKTLHFITCPATGFSPPLASRGRRESQTSLYSIHSCLLCQEPDDQLEDVVETLLPLLEQLENEDDLNIPLRTIEYFLQITCFTHFEQGIKKVIGCECTPKNVARFHYLMRRIVRHIGDPADESDKTIENILNHAKRFNMCFYQPHIRKVYQSMTNFILSGLQNDDVD